MLAHMHPPSFAHTHKHPFYSRSITLPMSSVRAHAYMHACVRVCANVDFFFPVNFLHISASECATPSPSPRPSSSAFAYARVYAHPFARAYVPCDICATAATARHCRRHRRHRRRAGAISFFSLSHGRTRGQKINASVNAQARARVDYNGCK